jgi:hypothetical protein
MCAFQICLDANLWEERVKPDVVSWWRNSKTQIQIRRGYISSDKSIRTSQVATAACEVYNDYSKYVLIIKFRPSWSPRVGQSDQSYVMKSGATQLSIRKINIGARSLNYIALQCPVIKPNPSIQIQD